MRVLYPLLSLCAAASSCSLQSEQPNVIVILGDDYSFGEHGIYGNEIIQTPNIDRLIEESVSFDNFYVGATSAPTRAQLMTGNHEFRGGITHTKYPRAYLNLNEKILPEYFAESGYSTAHFGKWHLGNDTFDDEYSARARGFDTSLVSDYKVHFDPELRKNGEMKKYEGFRTDILFEEAIKWLASGDKEPKLCWIATNSAHMPFDAPEEYKEMYRGKLKTRGAEDYYAMISNIDDNVGRLVEHLKQSKQYDNTILVYMTDNGHVIDGYNAGMRGRKGSQYRGGSRVPFAIHCHAKFDGGRVIGELAGGIDFLPTILKLCNIEIDKATEGVDLSPLILGKKTELDERFMVCHTGRLADGEADKHKYIKYALQNSRFRLVDNVALYDIENDPSETTNVIDKHPELVAQMREYYDAWWSETRPKMVNEERAINEGGSRLSIEDVEYRKQNPRYVLDMVHHNPGEPHENLVIGIKHCEGDFHRANLFSKVIGEGRHRQIIEVQCAREYEGKGAYPNYIANGVIEGFEEHALMPEEKLNSLREFAHNKPRFWLGGNEWGSYGNARSRSQLGFCVRRKSRKAISHCRRPDERQSVVYGARRVLEREEEPSQFKDSRRSILWKNQRWIYL